MYHQCRQKDRSVANANESLRAQMLNPHIKQESQMAYGTAKSFPGVYVFFALNIFVGKPRKQTHLIIVREKNIYCTKYYKKIEVKL